MQKKANGIAPFASTCSARVWIAQSGQNLPIHNITEKYFFQKRPPGARPEDAASFAAPSHGPLPKKRSKRRRASENGGINVEFLRFIYLL